LNRYAHGESWDAIADRFGGDATAFSRAFEWFVDHLFFSFYHAICGDSLRRWLPMVDTFRQTIGAKFQKTPSPFETTYYGLFDDDYIIDMNIDDFTTFAFIDATNVRSCRVGAGPMKDGHSSQRRNEANLIQQAFFSGYLRSHGLKFLTVSFPNGLFGSVFGCSMAQNDLGAFNMSGMDEYLCEILQPINENSTVLPTLFGDRIFKAAAKRCQTVLVAHEFDEDDEFAEYFTIFTKRMNVCRQSEELMYGALFSTFKLLTNRSKHKILGGGNKAYRCAVVGFLNSLPQSRIADLQPGHPTAAEEPSMYSKFVFSSMPFLLLSQLFAQHVP
jgi:hypothetical protein